MYEPHYSDKPPKVSGDEWETQTLEILKQVFPNQEIQRQVRFPELPRAIIDFYVPSAKIAIECKACGLTPVQDKVLINHKNRQDVLKSLGITYIWWVDRESQPRSEDKDVSRTSILQLSWRKEKILLFGKF